MAIEQTVAQHYAQGALEVTIFAALAASGKNPANLVTADLAPIDEFHIGGRQATVDFAAELGTRPSMRLLDIGSGLGGASRYFAEERGCRVVGVDLTEEYVRLAETFAKMVALEDRVSYQQGSALSLPFAPASFDGAYMLHVGMNIDDKAKLFAQVRRVLKAGGVFGIYDVMRESDDSELSFPVPWASSPETSFVVSSAAYRSQLENAGFIVEKVRSRREFAIAFYQQMRERATQSGGPPPVGLHLLMGESAPQKIANMIDNLGRGLIAPNEIISRAS